MSDLEVVNELEILEPSVKTILISIGKDESEFIYQQKPLSFFGKMELFSLLGDAVNKALQEGELSIAEIFEIPEEVGLSSSATDLKEADVFIKAIAKIVQYVP